MLGCYLFSTTFGKLQLNRAYVFLSFYNILASFLIDCSGDVGDFT